MSTIANLDVNIRVNAQGLVHQINTVALKFTWLGNLVKKNLVGIAKMGSLGSMLSNAIMGMPSEVYFGIERLKNAFGGLFTAAKGLGRVIAGAFTGNAVQAILGFKGLITGSLSLMKNLSMAAVEFLGLWAKMGLQHVDEMAHVKRLAENLGTRSEFISGLQYHAKMEPIEIERLLREYQRNVTGMTNKNKTVQKAFGEMNLVPNQLMRKGLEEGIYEMADAFDTLGNSMQKAGVRQELFGRRGIWVEQVLRGGSKAIKESIAEAQALGYAFTDSEGDEVLRAKYALDEMKMGWQGLGRTAAITMAPLFRGFADLGKEALKWLAGWRSSLLKWATWMEYTLKHMEQVWEISWAKVFNGLQWKWAQTLDWMASKLNALFDAVGLGNTIRIGVDVSEAVKEEMRIEKLQKKLEFDWQKFLDDKMTTPKPETFKDTTDRSNAVALAGSLEAYKVMVGEGDKRLRVQQGIWNEVKQIRQNGEKRAPQVRVGNVRRGKL